MRKLCRDLFAYLLELKYYYSDHSPEEHCANEKNEASVKKLGRVADPDGVDPDPYPTLKNSSDPDPN